MISKPIRLGVLCLAPLFVGGAITSDQLATERGQTNAESRNTGEKQSEERALKVQYLEIVTPSVTETCDALAQAHGVEFSEPVPQFGSP